MAFATAISSLVAADTLIGLDWGASRVRAFRYDDVGIEHDVRTGGLDLGSFAGPVVYEEWPMVGRVEERRILPA